MKSLDIQIIDIYIYSFYFNINIFTFDFDTKEICVFYHENEFNPYKINIFISKNPNFID